MASAVLVELASPEAAVGAARASRALGHRVIEAYTPFAVEGLAGEIGLRRTRIPRAALAAGLLGVAVAVVILSWTNAIDEPLDVGGRPAWSWPADVPIAFETAVLFAAVTTFALALVASGLPRLHDPIMDVEGFERTCIDRFWIVVSADGLAADGALEATMKALGAVRFEPIPEAP